jgi:hypothetical protein
MIRTSSRNILSKVGKCAGTGRISGMIGLDDFGRVSEISSRKPLEFLARAFITGPSDIVAQATSIAPIKLRVENLRNLEFQLTVYFYRCRWRHFPIRDGIREGWFQLRHMEDGMHGSEVGRHFDNEGKVTNFADEVERSEETFGQLASRTSGVKELR